ncbi:hypothetical protein YTPLAS18_22020 [Nitrospira sp.]|nr:hypothetical protein YTPLAS18_22020 [Nitrospira sp.]
MPPAEVEYLLSFRDAANRRPRQTAPTQNQIECRDGERLLRCTNERDIYIAGEEADVGADIVIGSSPVLGLPVPHFRG